MSNKVQVTGTVFSTLYAATTDAGVCYLDTVAIDMVNGVYHENKLIFVDLYKPDSLILSMSDGKRYKLTIDEVD